MLYGPKLVHVDYFPVLPISGLNEIRSVVHFFDHNGHGAVKILPLWCPSGVFPGVVNPDFIANIKRLRFNLAVVPFT